MSRYQVWYMKPDFFRNGITGTTPDPKNLAHTHVHLKDVDADGINAVYTAMQGEVWSPNGEARELIQSKGLQHTSMSVGDVIVDDVGNAHLVANIGFKAIGGVKPDWQISAIAATRNTQLGSILACAMGREIPPPCFVGKATITSDGYIMCNFIGADGRSHMGAFVGSAADLARNARGLADHLKLEDTQRKELYDTVVSWIGGSYKPDALKELAV